MYDIAIIGSGASGGAVAYQLCKSGYKVLMLEKGRLIRREAFSKDELAYCRRDTMTPNLFEEYHVIERKRGKEWVATPTYKSGMSFWNGNMVGGSSNIMSGMFHRLHPYDFKLKSKFGTIKGANVVDWPINYEEIEPYYTLAERLVGITGKYKPHPYEPPRSKKNFFQQATQENPIVKLFDKSCEALNIISLVTPRAILSQRVGNRDACYYSNFCGSYGCSSGAKGSSLEALITPALATGNLTLKSNTHVTHLKSSKNLVNEIVAIDTITKKEKRFKANVVILAAQAHESVRLLFNSKNRYYPKGLANSSGELGKNLLFSGGGFGQGEFHAKDFDEKTFAGFMQRGLFVNRSILDWYVMKNFWGTPYKGGLVEFMFEHQNGISRAVQQAFKYQKLTWGDSLTKALTYQFQKTKSLRFEIFNDWLPTDDSYISIDENHKDIYGMPVGKLRIHGHPKDVEIGKEIAEKCEELLTHMGAKNIFSVVNSEPSVNLVAGGCRFGNNPQTSVLNKYCQTHDIKNLFVVDASFMPTGGSVAHTWTIYANALRVGEYIKKRHKKSYSGS
jgi:choline dehydrogenase-like flavoprotein